MQADASSALRDELERLTGDYNFALQRKYAFPAALQVVEDVTKLLPDDTWLTQFEMKTTARGKDARREIVLRGESANAGRLVSLLEDSKVFEQAAPRSPTTKIQPGPGEIFDLGAQLKTLPMPRDPRARRDRASPCRRAGRTPAAPGAVAARLRQGGGTGARRAKRTRLHPARRRASPRAEARRPNLRRREVERTGGPREGRGAGCRRSCETRGERAGQRAERRRGARGERRCASREPAETQ